jgi:hypothetical protein
LFIEPKLVGNEAFTATPADWPKKDRALLWRQLFEDTEKLAQELIPQDEIQSSEILSINAQLMIPLAPHTSEERNAAIKKIVGALSQVGQLCEIKVESAKRSHDEIPALRELPKKQTEKNTPSSLEEGLISEIWKSRFKWPLIMIIVLGIAICSIYVTLPDEIKIKLWKLIAPWLR